MTNALMTMAQGVLLIPCYNEAPRIGRVVDGIRHHIPVSNIAVIDDASSDQTTAIAHGMGAKVLTHATNLGYGAALETGYRYAQQAGCLWLAQMDGDGQHLPSELPRIVEPVRAGKADIVIGSRYRNDGTASGWQGSALRRTGHRVFSEIIFRLTGQRFLDPTSGFQAMNRPAFTFFTSGIFPCDYPDSDVIVMALRAGLRILEVPVTMLPRSGGVSMHAGLKPLYYSIKMLFSLFLVVLNDRNWKDYANTHHAGTQPT
ncbi:MAG: hypothetical protein A2269_09280 [Lentisphaerae bacterium RIFOXYA12_FULL_60_10]|nr:MAG: hypothetical protein A2269_09280 [Lentisphaerae bacterium RIFOXYA12_FULL_60_10]